jgi:preprotein translocase subunit SecD
MKKTTKRVIWGFVVALIAILIIASQRWSSNWPPRADLEFRIVSVKTCANCLTIEQETGPNEKTTVYLKPPFVTSADIRSINANVRGNPVIDFKFFPESKSRIQQVTSESVGQEIAVLAGGQIVEIFRLAAPFSDSMQMNGLAPDVHQKVFFSVVGTDRNAHKP